MFISRINMSHNVTTVTKKLFTLKGFFFIETYNYFKSICLGALFPAVMFFFMSIPLK